jgi:DNA helicase-2/ATP-dependent DNA helicase PcrA
MPYQIIGGTKFYERAEIKDAIAYLRVLCNPRSDVDMLRIINTPPRGIGNTTVERVAAYASTQRLSLFETLEGLVDFSEDLGTAPKKRLGQFRELMRALVTESKERPPADVLRMVLAKSGYKTALEAEDTAEAEGRLENLAELEGSMHDYAIEAEARGEQPTLDGFLERVSLQADTDNMDKEGAPRERVTLMTVHGAKGLEFELVMLTGMEEDMFPYQNNQERKTSEEMEEERRLAYVAVTRARQHLVVTHTRQRQIFGITRLGTPSRFVGDLPPDTVEHLETPAARAAGGQGRWIDRDHTAPTSWRPAQGRPATATAAASAGGWRHPQAARPEPIASREPGERFVEYEEASEGTEGVSLQRGMTVRHDKFGRGEVLKVVSVGEPAVVAFFPGWGEKKVLARFLKLG